MDGDRGGGPTAVARRAHRAARLVVHRARNVRDRWRRSTPDAAAPGVDTSCHAPFSTLFFDTQGAVRSCSRNHLPLGHVSTDSIRSIWDGVAVGRLRGALTQGDFSRGCDWCGDHDASGESGLVYARLFDRYAPSSPEPAWPIRMEFSLSNTCNLQCVMCNGLLSSSIRSQRDQLPPLPAVYPESFFAELVEFVPHLQSAGFAGGEPLLARESLRVLELLVEHAPHVRCNVATNGTIWNERVERILDALDVDVGISVDGGRAEVFESIRQGASFERVVANLDRFVARARRKGTSVEIEHCLMPQNVDSFHEVLRLAEERGVPVQVNVVRSPRRHSVDLLPTDELASAVESLARQRDEWQPRLERNGHHLDHELRRLQRRLDARATSAELPENPGVGFSFRSISGPGTGPVDVEQTLGRLRGLAPEGPYVLEVDGRDHLGAPDPRTAERFGVAADVLAGAPLADFLRLTRSTLGVLVGHRVLEVGDDVLDIEASFTTGTLRVVLCVGRDDRGSVTRRVVAMADVPAPT